MEHAVETTLTVNGTQVSRRIPARQHLVDFLREELGLTGSHIGCEHGVCGACTVRVDGQIVRGCLMLAVRPTAAGWRPSKAFRIRKSSPGCKKRFTSTTRCSAASARPAC